MNIQDFWAVPKRAFWDTDIQHVHGVWLEDKDEDK